MAGGDVVEEGAEGGGDDVAFEGGEVGVCAREGGEVFGKGGEGGLREEEVLWDGGIALGDGGLGFGGVGGLGHGCDTLFATNLPVYRSVVCLRLDLCLVSSIRWPVRERCRAYSASNESFPTCLAFQLACLASNVSMAIWRGCRSLLRDMRLYSLRVTRRAQCMRASKLEHVRFWLL